jgi:two-component system OmpR family sensor kinase
VNGLLTRQRQVLADAAHELNTPLAAVKLQAQLARRSDDGHRQAALDELDRGIERSTHLVAQLLQMARLEPDVQQRHPAPLRCDQMAAEVVSAFSARADARAIDLGLETSDAATVCMDPEDFRVLLNNLVDNALRHTPAGSRVDIRVRLAGQRVTLTVSDNGPGIEETQRGRVLERFVRLNPQDATGSGLGLAIVARIAEHYGGQIELGESPGGGLAVTVHLPVHPLES